MTFGFDPLAAVKTEAQKGLSTLEQEAAEAQARAEAEARARAEAEARSRGILPDQPFAEWTTAQRAAAIQPVLPQIDPRRAGTAPVIDLPRGYLPFKEAPSRGQLFKTIAVGVAIAGAAWLGYKAMKGK